MKMAAPVNRLSMLPILCYGCVVSYLEQPSDARSLSRVCRAISATMREHRSFLQAWWLWRKFIDEAIFWAWRLGSVPILRHLIQFGADLSHRRCSAPPFMPNASGSDSEFGVYDLLLRNVVKRGDVGFLACMLEDPRFNVNSLQDDELPSKRTYSAGDRIGLTNILHCRETDDGIVFPAPEVLALLLAVPNLDVNFVDDEGFAAVHHAARAGDWTSMHLLLTHPRIDINVLASDGVDLYEDEDGAGDEWFFGHTALDFATYYSHASIVKLLKVHAAEIL